MKRINKTIASVAFGAMAFGAAGAAYAGSTPQPGEFAGVAVGAPLPEGVYFLDVGSVGGYRGLNDSESSLAVNIPALVWSTPWTLFGARVEGLVAAPEVAFGVPSSAAFALGHLAGRDYTAMYNPAVAAGLAWDVGGGLGIGLFAGTYFPDSALSQFGHDEYVPFERFAISYAVNGWSLNATGIFQQPQTDQTFHIKYQPDNFEYDLSATKRFGKWEFGVVAFGSQDLEITPANAATGKQAQFAVGPLVGYHFPGITTQLMFTKDVWSEGFYNVDGTKSYESRLWTRVIIPLWSPPAPELLK